MVVILSPHGEGWKVTRMEMFVPRPNCHRSRLSSLELRGEVVHMNTIITKVMAGAFPAAGIGASVVPDYIIISHH